MSAPRKATALIMIGCLFFKPAWCQLLEFQHAGADIIVDATIQNVRSVQLHYQNVSETCGFIYEATVTESFRGRQSGTIRFGSNTPLQPQGRYLLLLQLFEGEFPTDSRPIPFFDPDDPGLHAGYTKARKSCLAALPRLKTYTHPMGGAIIWPIFPSANGQVQFVHGGNLAHGLRKHTMEIPEVRVDGRPVKPGTDGVGMSDGWSNAVTAWEELRQWLHQNVPEKRPAAYHPPTLKQTNATLRRSLHDSRRHFAARPEVLAAIDASHGAWADFMQASCDSVIAVWPDRKLHDPLLEDCRIRITSDQAAELPLLRHESAEYVFRSYTYIMYDEECEDTCLNRQLASFTKGLDDTLKDLRSRHDDRPDVIATIDASQVAWEAWAKARCVLVTAVWPDSTLRDSLLLRCRLRSMLDWGEALARLDESRNEVIYLSAGNTSSGKR